MCVLSIAAAVWLFIISSVVEFIGHMLTHVIDKETAAVIQRPAPPTVCAQAHDITMAGTEKSAATQQRAGPPPAVKAYLLLYNGALAAG